MPIPSSVSTLFKVRDLDDVLETTTQAELAGRAADSIREDCFKQHVAKAHNLCAWSDNTNKYTNPTAVDTYLDELWQRESDRILKQYFRNKNRGSLTLDERKQFNNKSNPFRSMKSVVRSAVVEGAALVDEEGMPLGKTALQMAIKQEKDPHLKFIDVMRKAQMLVPKLSDTDVPKLTVLMQLADDVREQILIRIKNATPF